MKPRLFIVGAAALVAAFLVTRHDRSDVTVSFPAAHDVSPPLATLLVPTAPIDERECEEEDGCGLAPMAPQQQPNVADLPRPPVTAAGAAVEQTFQGRRSPAVLLESFDGHGYGLVGPHGTGRGGNPTDNSLAAGRNHLMETVNGGGVAIYTKKGELFDETGRVLFGPMGVNVFFSGFGGECEAAPNGDTVVRYDQLAERWLVVMPLFRRASVVPPGRTEAPYGMCYAVSTSENPLGPYYRYYYERELFPDYPRPAIWPDGYYVPTSTGDNLLPDGRLPEKHICIVERAKMLVGEPAQEQCLIIDDVNFLNNADIDGWGLPPAGAPNIMIATGGAQLRNDFTDDGIQVWNVHVDWDNPSNTKAEGPTKVTVAPYNYLCNGQLTRCVPQPGTDTRIDSQGDKIMQRVVYRNIDGVESLVAVHSVGTAAGGGGVRWYEFRLNDDRDLVVHQQGTYAPDGFYRWMASPGIDRQGNIAMGYSFGGTPHYPGQRFAGRLDGDSLGALTLQETVLVEGQGSQNGMRWQDYTQLAIDPVDDCTMWYVGDYLKQNAPSQTTRIGAFRLPGCLRGTVSGTVFFDRNRNGFREPNEAGLEGWQVRYDGVRTQRDLQLPASGMLATNDAGDFTTWLPADPAYNEPAYTISAPSSRNPSWTRIENGTAYWSGGEIPMMNGAYTVHLKDRDAVSYLSFGNVCVVANAGAQGMAYWTNEQGRSVLNANDQQPADPARGGRGGRGRGGRGQRGGGDAGWRTLLNFSTLVNAGGSSFQVPAGDFLPAYDAFRTWTAGAANTQNPSYALSVQAAVTALNTAYGSQDGNVTVHDPIEDDWVTVNALLARVSAFIEADPRGGNRAVAEAYRTLFESLNANTAMITPAGPERCPTPFQ
jgi:hypothetical protein